MLQQQPFIQTKRGSLLYDDGSSSSSVASSPSLRTSSPLDHYPFPHSAQKHVDEELFTEKKAVLLRLISRAEAFLDNLSALASPLLASNVPSPDAAVPQTDAKPSFRDRIGNTLTLGLRVAENNLKDNLKIRTHLHNLRARIEDTKSRVLVTGDLNAGKSTFINALLHRQVVPDDQQPCTALFCEVVDVSQNSGIEEVHGITVDPTEYSIENTDSYKRLDIRSVRDIVEENEDSFEMVKVYCQDNRPDGESLLRNGVVDISLIDSPGLNIDMMKTLALFSKQETIDVIIFVVNAENHFTLSGREFLTLAGLEKAYIFIVVNRFDQIRRKDRCRKDILTQIREISPQTYAERDSLVHFVSAKQRLETYLSSTDPSHPVPLSESQAGTTISDFINLEESLRSFIFEKRLRSKLAPAKTYLINLLSDLSIIAQNRHQTATVAKANVTAALTQDSPNYQSMLRIKNEFLDNLEKRVDDTATKVTVASEKQLEAFLDAVDEVADSVRWHGVWGVWTYATALRNKVYELASRRVVLCENFAKHKALACVLDVEAAAKTLAQPPVVDLSVIESGFRVSGVEKATENGNGAAGKEKPEVSAALPLELDELFEYQDRVDILKEYVPSVLMATAGLVGYQSSAMARGLGLAARSNGVMGQSRLLFVGLGLAGVGLFMYVLSDMKATVDRKVLTKMRTHLGDTKFVDNTVSRLTESTRRVLKLAFWEFENQFNRMLAETTSRRDKLGTELREMEILIKKCEAVDGDVKVVLDEVEALNLEE
ncbi:mitofusin [Nowakowskiella sp. JEL0078]|nr:mitofusin [Nowakowskiella sp. JEL0078]